MLYINLTVDIKEFDADMYMADLGRAMKAEFIWAAKAFYLAAVPLVHIDTGMSLGSYMGFARLVKEKLDLSQRWIYTPPKKYMPRGGPVMDKVPASGAALSSKKDEIVVQKGGRNSPDIAFHFETKVWHYSEWDVNGINGGAPWNSFRAGRDAMMNELKNLAAGVPPISRYMVATRIRTNSIGGVTTNKVDERRQWTSPKTL